MGKETIRKQLEGIEVRLAVVEEENRTTKAIRKARRDRRDFWVVKLLPSISGVAVAILGFNALFHWF